MAATPIFGQNPNANDPQTFTSADTTDLKTVFTAGAKGSKLSSIAVTSDDTAAIYLAIYLNDGVTDFRVGTVLVAGGSGTDGSKATDALDPAVLPWLDALGELPVPAGYTIEVGCVSTMTAAKTMTVVGIGSDY